MRSVGDALRQRPADVGLTGTLGTAGPSRPTSSASARWTLGCAGANASSANLGSRGGSLVRGSLAAAPVFGRLTTRTRGPQRGSLRGLLGEGRAPLPTPWHLAPHVGPAGGPRPDPPPCGTHNSAGGGEAVRRRDGKRIYRREEGVFNQVSGLQLLHRFYRASPRGPRRVVVIGDTPQYHRAHLHKGGRHELSLSLELPFLPGACPQWHPIERVWQLIRRGCLHNRHFPKLEDVSTAVEHTLEGWRRGPRPSRECAPLRRALRFDGAVPQVPGGPDLRRMCTYRFFRFERAVNTTATTTPAATTMIIPSR